MGPADIADRRSPGAKDSTLKFLDLASSPPTTFYFCQQQCSKSNLRGLLPRQDDIASFRMSSYGATLCCSLTIATHDLTGKLPPSPTSSAISALLHDEFTCRPCLTNGLRLSW